MAALAPPPPAAPAPTSGLPTPPTPNGEPRLNTPPTGSAGLEAALAGALSGQAHTAPPLKADGTPDLPAPMPPPAQPADPADPAAPAPAEEPPTPPGLDEFDFENPPEEAASPDSSPLDPVKDLLTKEGELSGAEADKVRGAFLKTEHGRQMLAAQQIRRELEKPPEEGGLGRMPTLEEIRQGETDRLAMAEMQEDFQSNPPNFLANFFGYRDAQGQTHFRPGVESVLDLLPQHLEQVAPQLHSRAAASFVAPYLHQLAQEISRLPQSTREEADAKLTWGRGLNAIEQRLLGQITRIPGFTYEDGQGGQGGQGTPGVQGAPDPERARFEQERAAFLRQQQQAAHAQQQARHQEILTTRDSTLLGDVKTILRSGGLEKAVTPLVAEQLAKTFLSQVQLAIEGDQRNARSPINPAGLKTYSLHLRSAVAGQADPTLPVNTYRRMAQEVMRRDAKAFLEAAIGAEVQRNQSTHAAAARAAARTDAPSGGPQGAPSEPLKPGRAQGQSGGDFLEQQLRSALGATS